jgi:ATP-dependent RNA helicase MSS116
MQRSVGTLLRKDHLAVHDLISNTSLAQRIHSRVQQSHVIIPNDSVFSSTVTLLYYYLAKLKPTKKYDENQNPKKLLVFFQTTDQVKFYVSLFKTCFGIRAWEMHGHRTQRRRTETMAAFQKYSTGAMFTSDLSARGIRYPGVTDVLQFGLPENVETYIQRAGRVNWDADAENVSNVLVLAELERNFLYKIEDFHVPLNEELQQLVVRGPDAQLAAMIADVRKKVFQQEKVHLNKILNALYKSVFGFYCHNAKMSKLGVRDKNRLVKFVNDFVAEVGLPRPPAVQVKEAKFWGLEDVQKLRLIRNLPAGSKASRDHIGVPL